MSSTLSARGASTLRTAGGHVGLTPRPKNPLLVKDDVGRARPSCYDLPGDAFSFGRPANQDLEGAREVSMRWVSHTPSRAPEETAPDFVTLHRKAAGARVATARDLKHYRAEHELLATPRGGGQGSDAPGSGPPKALVPSDVIPGFTYGRKVRPSTPIHEVISNRFGEKAEVELLRFNERFEEHKAQRQGEVRKIPLTIASRGHASAAKNAAMQADEPKELFKMSKFQRKSHTVDTRRTRPARAYEEDSDAGSRVPAASRTAVSVGGEFDNRSYEGEHPILSAEAADEYMDAE